MDNCETLIIAPHPDDEVLGCSSFLESPTTVVVYVTTYHPGWPNRENVDDNKQLVEALEFMPNYSVGTEAMTNRLDTYPLEELIDTFEKLIKGFKPNTVLVPAPSYNQDHRAVYDAALTAMRAHDTNYFVKRILVYEQPETFGSMRMPNAFQPTYFRLIDIQDKLGMMMIYKTQIRGHRSLSHIKAIARVRGMQVNMEHAEAFEVMRWID